MSAASRTAEGAAVITGVGSGIGRALAERLAGQGRHVLGVSRDLGGWAARAALPAGFDVVAADLSTSEGIARALEQIHDVTDEKREQIDILVHSAGTVGALGPVYERTVDEIDTVLTLHAKAPLLLTTGLTDVLSNGARVLSISTRSAHATFPGVSMYAMAKHAQHSVTTTTNTSARANVSSSPRAYQSGQRGSMASAWLLGEWSTDQPSDRNRRIKSAAG